MTVTLGYKTLVTEEEISDEEFLRRNFKRFLKLRCASASAEAANNTILRTALVELKKRPVGCKSNNQMTQEAIEFYATKNWFSEI